MVPQLTVLFFTSLSKATEQKGKRQMTNLSSTGISVHQAVKRKTPQRGVLAGEPERQETHNGEQAQCNGEIFAGGTGKIDFI
jgi:hypothetical protein